MKNETILIVGAGPTGLFLAYLLAKRGQKVRIIDQKKGISKHSKALALHARTLEILALTGIVEPFLEEGLKIQDVCFHKKKACSSFSFTEIDSVYPFILSLPQDRTEALLNQELEKIGIQVEWETQFTGAHNNKALIFKKGEQEEIPYQWLMGCDGGRSQVRTFFNFTHTGLELHEQILLLDIEGKLLVSKEAFHVFLTKKGPAVCFPISESRARLILPHFEDFPKGGFSPTVQDVSTFLEKRSLFLFESVDSIIWTSIFALKQRMTKQMRKKNIFLVGDSCHVHSPLGGQGMNTCLQDAFNLAWKLDLVQKKYAYHSLLDSYQEERQPVIKKLLQMTSALSKRLLNTPPFLNAIFFQAIRLIKKTPLANYIREALSQTGIGYPKSSWVRGQSRDSKWKGPKPGERLPDVFLENGTRFYSHLNPLKHTLVVFSEDSLFLKTEFANEYAHLLHCVCIQENKVMERLAAEPTSLYLIRPDGYIAYRTREMRIEEVISYLFRIFKPASLQNKV